MFVTLRNANFLCAAVRSGRIIVVTSARQVRWIDLWAYIGSDGQQALLTMMTIDCIGNQGMMRSPFSSLCVLSHCLSALALRSAPCSVTGSACARHHCVDVTLVILCHDMNHMINAHDSSLVPKRVRKSCCNSISCHFYLQFVYYAICNHVKSHWCAFDLE